MCGGTGKEKMNPFIKNNVLLITRGASGAGKTTFADFLEFMIDDPADIGICCADDYFFIDGKYTFDVAKLGKAHSWCREKCQSYMLCDTKLVVVANTSTRDKEVQPYIDMAEEYGYEVVSLVVENRKGTENIHGVPKNTLGKQKERLLNSIKL